MLLASSIESTHNFFLIWNERVNNTLAWPPTHRVRNSKIHIKIKTCVLFNIVYHLRHNWKRISVAFQIQQSSDSGLSWSIQLSRNKINYLIFHRVNFGIVWKRRVLENSSLVLELELLSNTPIQTLTEFFCLLVL